MLDFPEVGEYFQFPRTLKLTSDDLRLQLNGNSKTRPSGLSLASKGLENVPQVPGDPPEVGPSHDARNALSVSLSVLK